MSRLRLFSFVFALTAISVFAAGCTDIGGDEDGGKSGSHSQDHDHDHDSDHGHDHDHDHPAHGPNHGHIFDLDNAEYQVEWCKYKDNNIIRMYVLDGEGKVNKPIKADSFVVRSLAGSDGQQFEFEPEDAGEDGATAVYMLDDQALSVAIPLGVEIEIKMGDQTMKGQIKAHEPLDH